MSKARLMKQKADETTQTTKEEKEHHKKGHK